MIADNRLTRALRPEHDPGWLNPASLKGSLLVLAGIGVVATPDGERPFRVAVGVGVLLWAAADLWLALGHRRRHRTLGLAQFAVLIALGLSLIALTSVEISEASGVALIVLGAVMVVRRLGRGRGADREHGSAWTWLAVVPVVAVGIWLLVLPGTSVLAVRAVLGGTAILLGGVLIRIGLDRGAQAGGGASMGVGGVPRLAAVWLDGQRMPSELSEGIAETLYFEEPRRRAKLAAFWVMMGLATAIATFAIIQDSTAVVIGAMLVAPLMTPIMGTAAAAVNGWPRRVGSSIALVGVAAAGAVGLAWIITAWLPSVGNLMANSQVTSRVEPNLLDLCIALAAGAAGAYATVNPRVSSSLSGVAIAVALVPPLAVVGITFEVGMYSESFGALLLFGTNFVCIVLASALVFVLTGFSQTPPAEDQRHRFAEVLGAFLTVAVLIAVPLSLTTQRIWTSSREQADLEVAVQAWLPEDSDLAVVEVTASGDGSTVVLTGADRPPSVDRLVDEVARLMGVDRSSVDLYVRVIPSVVLRPGGS